MRHSIKTLSAALLAVGCGSVVAPAMAEQTPYYNPSNVGGKTTGYELFKTIGCPGQPLLGSPCKEETPTPAPQPAPVEVKSAPAPAPVPAPVPKKPEIIVKSNLPNAKPGECYGKVITKPEYRREMVKTLVKPAGERIEVVPAVYETVKEKVLVKEASTRLEVVPAVYEEVEERVLVRPAYRRAIEVPALYDTVTDQILVKPAYTTWKPGTQTNIQKIDEKSGEIFCLVEVPAEYRNETRQVLKQPASLRYEDVPAEYTTVKKTVLKSPEKTRVVAIPAEYAEREVVRMVAPPQEKRIVIPAQYVDVETKVLADAGEERWSQILCDANATPAKISEIQTALQATGFYTGPIDGVLGPNTMDAVTAYQKVKNLPVDGYLNMATVKSLGVSPQ